MKEAGKISIELKPEQLWKVKDLADFAAGTHLKTVLFASEQLLSHYKKVNDLEGVAKSEQSIARIKSELEAVEAFGEAIVQAEIEAGIIPHLDL